MIYLDKILKMLKSDKVRARYSHDNKVYRQDKKMVFEVDCSGLFEFWLSKRYPAALDEIYDFIYAVRSVDKAEIQRLYSFDVYDFFAHIAQDKSIYWQPVDINAPLQAGDVIAFVKEGEKNRFGHVAIVRREVERSPEKIVVQVMDSSRIEHLNDWRQSSDGGIGEGALEMYRQKGDVTAICYKPDCVKIRKVAAGRLKKQT